MTAENKKGQKKLQEQQIKTPIPKHMYSWNMEKFSRGVCPQTPLGWATYGTKAFLPCMHSPSKSHAMALQRTGNFWITPKLSRKLLIIWEIAAGNLSLKLSQHPKPSPLQDDWLCNRSYMAILAAFIPQILC